MSSYYFIVSALVILNIIILIITSREKIENICAGAERESDENVGGIEGLLWNVDPKKSYMAGNIHNHHNREDSSRSSAFNDSIGGGFDSSSGGFGGGFGGSPFD